MLKLVMAWFALSISAAAQSGRPCTKFSVITVDKLGNVNEGLSADDRRWFHDKVEKKNPAICYADQRLDIPVMFVVTVTPDTYHGDRVVTDTQKNPITGTVTDEQGNESTVTATQTTTSSTVVPYSFEYGIYTLSVKQRQKDGSFVILHRFQQKGIYRTLYGVPLGGKGHHPAHAVIEEAAEWLNKNSLPNDPSTLSPGTGDPRTESVERSRRPEPESASPNPSTPGRSVTLDISSSPAGADIEIDGAFVGETPSSLEVSRGPHSIRISKKGFSGWERKITATSGHANISPELEKIEPPPLQTGK